MRGRTIQVRAADIPPVGSKSLAREDRSRASRQPKPFEEVAGGAACQGDALPLVSTFIPARPPASPVTRERRFGLGHFNLALRMPLQ